MKPILKWAGGKRQLVPTIQKLMPPGSRLIEPFAGGAALFFACTGPAILNDANCELINFYQQLRDDPEQLLDIANDWSRDEGTYYVVRDFDRASNFSTVDPIDRAARFLYLNKMAFNGMWRVNGKNQHNVPYNQKPQTQLPSLEQLREASVRLKDATITCGDYALACEGAGPGDFVYFDPPYHTSTFASYAQAGWGADDYAALVSLCLTVNLNGAIVCLSNLGVKEVLAPFEGTAFRVIHVDHRHIFAAKAINRRKADEVLIVNVNYKELSHA